MARLPPANKGPDYEAAFFWRHLLVRSFSVFFFLLSGFWSEISTGWFSPIRCLYRSGFPRSGGCGWWANNFCFLVLCSVAICGRRGRPSAGRDGFSICDFVSMGLLEHVREIVDRSLLLEEEEDVDHDNKEGRMEERATISDGDPQSSNARSGMVLDCMVSVLRIGLSCSDSLPSERIPMNIVANKMHAIRDSFLRFKKRNRK